MEYLLTAGETKKCDSDTIEQIGIPSMVLMERAALCLVEEMEQRNFPLQSVLVLCGSGNNGGDGFAAARLLWQKKRKVTVVFAGKESSLTKETALQKKICENCGINVSSNLPEGEYTTIVDALLGIGLSREVQGKYGELIDWVNHSGCSVVSVDIPSGIHADSGQVLGRAVRADLTVTFGFRKIGQVLYPGTEYCGVTVCRDIGFVLGEDALSGRVFTCGKQDLSMIRRRPEHSNKGTFGRVLLVAGSEGMCGAAVLSARAAYRTGAGLVRVFTPEINRQIVQTMLPEAIVTAWKDDQFPEENLKEQLDWADVIGIGPGIGTDELPVRILAFLLKHSKCPLVIDADGLNILAMKKMAPLSSAPVIVTPHVGEMMRLRHAAKEEILCDLIGTAEVYAREHQLVCVLKDSHTVVSDGCRTYINTTGNSGMATGGSGDVLTGVICGLLAQKMDPFDAAVYGVLAHGLAGDSAREKLSTYGVMAGDIAEHLGEVLKLAEEFK